MSKPIAQTLVHPKSASDKWEVLNFQLTPHSWMSIGALLILRGVKAQGDMPVLSDKHDVAQLAELPKKIIPASSSASWAMLQKSELASYLS